jgi:hypothetical protein
VPSTWAQHGEQRGLDITGAGVGAVCVTATGGHDAGGKPNRVAEFSKEKKPLVVAFFWGEPGHGWPGDGCYRDAANYLFAISSNCLAGIT